MRRRGQQRAEVATFLTATRRSIVRILDSWWLNDCNSRGDRWNHWNWRPANRENKNPISSEPRSALVDPNFCRLQLSSQLPELAKSKTKTKTNTKSKSESESKSKSKSKANTQATQRIASLVLIWAHKIGLFGDLILLRFKRTLKSDSSLNLVGLWLVLGRSWIRRLVLLGFQSKRIGDKRAEVAGLKVRWGMRFAHESLAYSWTQSVNANSNYYSNDAKLSMLRNTIVRSRKLVVFVQLQCH